MPLRFPRYQVCLPNADKGVMRRFFSKMSLLFFCICGITLPATAQGGLSTEPLYRLPEARSEKPTIDESAIFLVGTDSGLFRVLPGGGTAALWEEGKVDHIIKTQNKWFFLTDKGVLFSQNLTDFTLRNNGLPSLVIKTYDGTEKKLVKEVPLLKDLAADPFDENILVTATKDAVYLTRDGGETWKSIGSMSRYTAGIKAVACSHIDGELVIFMSHSIYGMSYYRADLKKPIWVDVSAGFSLMKSLSQPDELSDIVPVVVQDTDGKLHADIYFANSFLPNIFRFDWQKKRAVTVYHGSEEADTIDGLCQSNGRLVFSTLGKISSINLDTGEAEELPADKYTTWERALSAMSSPVNAAYIPPEYTGLETPVQLAELWLLKPDEPLSLWGEKANRQKSLYISSYQVRNMAGIEKYRKIIANNKLNSLVVDMKDDYGLLRFEPNSPLLKEKGSVTQYKIDVDTFVSEFKKDGTYLIGRIVVFKDKNLSQYGGGKYAVWDKTNKRPWIGTRGTEEIKNEDGEVTGTRTLYYDENWVDPYCEEVWEYNIEIAKELIERGFDEIQFDYIRFPTDGKNIGNASYRWRDEGMDKESALVSFLSYARKNINGPIGIDIYGANGWYRSGTRTGQDVELMSNYVDVICPMFYPSHFEQNFLEYPPVAERPYRIYFYGSYRNTVIGRNRIIVRPWVQAFYLNVRYDRAFYNKDYVQREIYGVRDGLNRGYMYWNNSGGNYDDISPDITDDAESPWADHEAKLQKRLPAFSSGDDGRARQEELQREEKRESIEKNEARKAHRADMLSILDSLLYKVYEDLPASSYPRFLNIAPILNFWKK